MTSSSIMCCFCTVYITHIQVTNGRAHFYVKNKLDKLLLFCYIIVDNVFVGLLKV